MRSLKSVARSRPCHQSLICKRGSECAGFTISSSEAAVLNKIFNILRSSSFLSSSLCLSVIVAAKTAENTPKLILSNWRTTAVKRQEEARAAAGGIKTAKWIFA